MASRRGNGEGSIKQRADGRWEARLEVGWRDGKRQRKYLFGQTRNEVAAKLRRAQGQTDRGVPVGDPRVTVGAYLEMWLMAQQGSGEKSVNTLAQYEWAIRKHLKPALGHKRLVQLSPEDVDEFLVELAGPGGCARSTLVRLRCVLAMALDQAVRRDHVGRNVATLATMPKGQPGRDSRALTEAQAAALLETVRGDRLEAAYVTMLMLGLRPGEALGLPWEKVDLEAGHVSIHQALKTERGKLLIGPLKTSGSRRAVALPRPVSDALRSHRRHQLEERMAAGPAWVDSGLVFTTQIGTPIDPANFRRAFDRVTRRAGLGHWHPHELRHSAVSLLSASGVRVEEIADIVGHVTTRMTTQVYRHQVTPTIMAGKAAMEQIFDFGGHFGGQRASGGSSDPPPGR